MIAILTEPAYSGSIWCKQLLDVVGQIASLSPPPDASPEQARAVTSLSMRAAEASLDLNRGVVSWSAV